MSTSIRQEVAAELQPGLAEADASGSVERRMKEAAEWLSGWVDRHCLALVASGAVRLSAPGQPQANSEDLDSNGHPSPEART